MLPPFLVPGDTVDFFKVHGNEKDERNVRRLFTKFHYLAAENYIMTNVFFCSEYTNVNMFFLRKYPSERNINNTTN